MRDLSSLSLSLSKTSRSLFEGYFLMSATRRTIVDAEAETAEEVDTLLGRFRQLALSSPESAKKGIEEIRIVLDKLSTNKATSEFVPAPGMAGIRSIKTVQRMSLRPRLVTKPGAKSAFTKTWNKRVLGHHTRTLLPDKNPYSRAEFLRALRISLAQKKAKAPSSASPTLKKTYASLMKEQAERVLRGQAPKLAAVGRTPAKPAKK